MKRFLALSHWPYRLVKIKVSYRLFQCVLDGNSFVVQFTKLSNTFDFIGYVINEMPFDSRFAVIVYGAFDDEDSKTTHFLYVHVQLVHNHVRNGSYHSDSSFTVYHDDVAKIPIIENVDDIDTAKLVQKSHTFQLSDTLFQQIAWNGTVLSLEIATNVETNFPINLAFDPSPIDKTFGIIYASILLLCLYVMIIWEIIDRTFAALLASTASIVILSLMNERPTMPEILSWIDTETLLLLFGMMILVGILSETGLFDYLAVYAFKVLFVLFFLHIVLTIFLKRFRLQKVNHGR